MSRNRGNEYTPWAVHFLGRGYVVRRERREANGSVFTEADRGIVRKHDTLDAAIERADELNNYGRTDLALSAPEFDPQHSGVHGSERG